MNIIKKLFISTTLLLTFAVTNTYSATQYDKDLDFNAAINKSIQAVAASTYKDIYVNTSSGSFKGEFVQKTKDVLILKEYTGNTHINTGKEKVALTFIKLADITSISVYVLE